MQNLFSKHPKEVGETYLQHLLAACRFSFILFGLSIIAVIHAVLPFIFKKIVSKKIVELADQLKQRK